MRSDNRVEYAVALTERAQADPARVSSEAAALIAEAGDSEAGAVARWAAGLGARELGDLRASENHLRAGIETADHLALASRAAQIRESLSFTLFLLGHHDEALAQAELAKPHLEGRDAARLEMQIGLLMQRLGRTADALDSYRTSLAGMQRAGDKLGETRLRINRSNVHTYLGDLKSAHSDLERAHRLAIELDQKMLVGACAHNLGFTEGRHGDVPAALRWYDEAAAVYAEVGIESGLAAVLLADRAELLLETGLTAEAARLASKAVETLGADANAADLAEAQVLTARSLLADARPEDAASVARAAAEAFETQRRPSWNAMAEYIVMQATFDLAKNDAEVPDALLDDARRVAWNLDSTGWTTEALHASVMAGRIALSLGRPEVAKRLLADAQTARTSGPASARAQAWHAAALARLADGNRTGAQRAVQTGMRVVEEHRASLGATELRAQAGIHGADLAELGLRIATTGRQPRSVLRWADRFRSVTMVSPSPRPLDSPQLRESLVQLRQLSRDAAEASLNGTPDGSIAAQRARVEEQVRRISHQQVGRAADGHDAPGLGGLDAALGDRTLIEYFQTADGIGAVRVRSGRASIHPLPDAPAIAATIDTARFDLHRLAVARGSDLARDAARSSLTQSAKVLEQALLDPLRVGDAPLVIVPTGSLHGVPWRSMDTLTDRPFTVAPSAAAWLFRANQSRRGDRALFAAGPGLPAARGEIVDLAAAYGGQRLIDSSARVGAVLEGLENVDIAHIAAHGEFRHDNPMFSSLQLSDGPLTVYELERLAHVPKTLVLPACDAAVSGVRAGDELVGLAAALLRLGTSTLVAPSVPVPDNATRELMLAFHANLEAGQAPAAALAAAGAGLDDDDPQAFAVHRSFLVLGSS